MILQPGKPGQAGVPAERDLIFNEKEEADMAKAKKGDYLSCEACGLVVVVDEGCGCAVTELLCCKKPMVRVKASAGRVKKQAAAKKPMKKPAKAAAKAAPAKATAKAPAKAAAKAKPAGKKPARAKK
jgi:hypothetical protein